MNYSWWSAEMSSGVSQPEEKSCSVFWWRGSEYFCICCPTAAGCTDCDCSHVILRYLDVCRLVLRCFYLLIYFVYLLIHAHLHS